MFLYMVYMGINSWVKVRGHNIWYIRALIHGSKLEVSCVKLNVSRSYIWALIHESKSDVNSV